MNINKKIGTNHKTCKKVFFFFDDIEKRNELSIFIFYTDFFTENKSNLYRIAD